MAFPSRRRPLPFTGTFAACARWLGAAVLLSSACTAGLIEPIDDQQPVDPVPVEEETSYLQGDNQGGRNLGGTNLGGTNLGGTNLGGPNLGGTNLGGTNLGASNLGGTNLGGNNLGGTNLGGTNLGGTNLGGTNLGGTNLGGTNLGGTNLGGTNLGGTNLAGNNLGGTNLGGTNLGGTNTGRNIHNLASGSINGLLYSAEDMWTPKTGQCVVMGIGSTAFAKLLGQQTAGTKISVALGKLPWGFATASGGTIKLQAWEAIVWGDKTYCVFVMGAPTDATWPGVAGFIKAVFRWNAAPGQVMEISGIEASASRDSTLSTTVATHTGMMNAAAHWKAGKISALALVAGELAFASATTNNTSVMVDFASWVQDTSKNPLVLGNVTNVNPPTYAEALYIALDNGDGTVQVLLDDAASRAKTMPAGMTNSVVDLNAAYLAAQQNLGPKPKPRRCGGALYLKTWFNETPEVGKCDDGLAWATGFCVKDADPWSKVANTVAPMNGYMTLNKAGKDYTRGLIAGNSCGTMKKVLSETYVHMWEPSYDIPYAAGCSYEGDASFCSRRGKNCGSVSGTDNCGTTRTVSNCGACASPATCGGSGAPNVCGTTTSLIFEAEGLGNDHNGATYVHACPEAYIKVLGQVDPAVIAGACAGGARLRYLGENSSNTTFFNNVTVPTAGTYTLTIYAGTRDVRKFYVKVNDSTTAIQVSMNGTDFGTMVSVNTTVTLQAGVNKLKFYNDTAPTPDLDRIKVTLISGGPTCVPESNTTFCSRQGRNCGSLTAVDNCGASRTVSSCGSCASPQTCGGAGFPNVCGAAAGGSCAGTAYAQAQCANYNVGTVVSSLGRNWTCVGGNCANCANVAGCAPGGTNCPWGVVWADGGSCGGGGGGGGSTCASAYATSSCLTYSVGTVVSKNGRNWTCANGNCMNCATNTTCQPGATGCPWGVVWTDSGTCN